MKKLESQTPFHSISSSFKLTLPSPLRPLRRGELLRRDAADGETEGDAVSNVGPNAHLRRRAAGGPRAHHPHAGAAGGRRGLRLGCQGETCHNQTYHLLLLSILMLLMIIVIIISRADYFVCLSIHS